MVFSAVVRALLSLQQHQGVCLRHWLLVVADHARHTWLLAGRASVGTNTLHLAATCIGGPPLALLGHVLLLAPFDVDLAPRQLQLPLQAGSLGLRQEQGSSWRFRLLR